MSEGLETLKNYKNITFYRGLVSQDVLDKIDIYPSDKTERLVKDIKRKI